MGEMLPLFPLGAVLYPGMLLPLHIFEGRYRQLISDLLDGAEPRRFGVIAIRKGRETGIDGVRSLYEIGCTATVRRVERHDDGRFEHRHGRHPAVPAARARPDAAVPAGRGRAAQ